MRAAPTKFSPLADLPPLCARLAWPFTWVLLAPQSGRAAFGVAGVGSFHTHTRACLCARGNVASRGKVCSWHSFPPEPARGCRSGCCGYRIELAVEFDRNSSDARRLSPHLV